MAPLLRVAPLIFGGFLTAAFAQTGPAGHWEGTLQVPNREIQIAADLAKDDKGSWIGMFSQGSPNPVKVPLADIKVGDKSVKFRMGIGGANAPDFDCTLASASAMTCTLTGPEGSLTSTMKRTGEGKVDLPKASPAVSAELEGSWEGAVETPNGSLRLAVHFKNQPDKTVKATMDSLDQNSMDLPLTDIVQKESAVEFQLRLVGGAYKGTLNKEATQMAGEWSQGGAALPLTLKKSPSK
ncbi:MAG: hypothetical protein NTW28_17435 [Candidatus Solibacter sp.]|nr:hypothetical protein [Candidatus Solibacter sp.]